jgi:hypothetical protein
MIGVMIGRQAVAVAQQANPPMVIAVKRLWPAVAVLRAAVALTVTIAQAAMIVQIVIVLQNVMTAPAVKVALKGEMVKLVRPAAVSRHLAASRPLTNVQILVISQRRKNHHPIAAVMAENAHHLPRKSALARRGQAAMPPRKAAKAH